MEATRPERATEFIKRRAGARVGPPAPILLCLNVNMYAERVGRQEQKYLCCWVFRMFSSACLTLFLPASGGEEERHKELLRQFSVNQCGFGSSKDFIPSVYYL